MHYPNHTQKCFQTKKNILQNEHDQREISQAPSDLKVEAPMIKVEFGSQIKFTLTSCFQSKDGLFSWLWKDEGCIKKQPLLCTPKTSIQASTASQQPFSPIKEQKKRKNYLEQPQPKKEEEKLYSEDEIGLLKKRLQLEFKGMLSKSTESDSTLGIPVVIRFKCKSFTATNNCPFYHYLEFCREEQGKILYKHKIHNSKHNPECTLDDENIQYNLIVRKLDSSTHIIENIISKDPTIKPKEILDIFIEQIDENENFLYEGLHTKSVKRSIKKYFDNLVAKVKSKFKN